MKRDLSLKASIGFTVLVATVTFAIAVVAGLFLIWQTGPGRTAFEIRTRATPQAQISLAAPDVKRGPDTAEQPDTGFNPEPAVREQGVQ